MNITVEGNGLELISFFTEIADGNLKGIFPLPNSKLGEFAFFVSVGQMVVPIHHPSESGENFACVFQFLMRNYAMEVAVVLCEEVLEVGEAHIELSLDGTTPP